MTQTAALIVAAGRGSRAGGGMPKQYRIFQGKPLLLHSLQTFQEHSSIDFVCVVINPEDRALFDALEIMPTVILADGGASREHSVKNGLETLSQYAPDQVLIHDAARPFLTPALIDRLCSALQQQDGAVPALPVTDALFSFAKSNLDTPIDRQSVTRVQTPQGFKFAPLLDAFRKDDDLTSAPDDATIALRAGLTVGMVDGESANTKVTFAEDFTMTGPSVPQSVSGSGFDVHRLSTGNGLWLCGVYIDCPYSLVGHSDADVALHALTDALLGAIGEGDIGQHFPPTEPKWKGAPSSRFLSHAVGLARRHHAEPIHADVTIICEAPKIGPHRDAMRGKIAELLQLPAAAVNIKATTTEGLGFTGRKEGIAAQAIVTVKKYE